MEIVQPNGNGTGTSLTVTDGITTVPAVTEIFFTGGATVTDLGGGIVGVSINSATVSDNEVVAGSGTAWTLAHTPVAGRQKIYARGQRMTPGGVDYTISGASVTTILSWSAGDILADYPY